MTTALIAEDEPVLAAEFCDELARLWPELSICAVVHDGAAALRALEAWHPEVMFLDVQMPGKSGLEVARMAGTRAHVVFITAFDHYAVQAFDAGAVDYLLKPLQPERLAESVRRLKERLVRPPADMGQLLARLALHRPQDHLRYVTVLSGREIRFITVDEICYFRADSKYVAVVTAEDEALISKPLKDLMA